MNKLFLCLAFMAWACCTVCAQQTVKLSGQLQCNGGNDDFRKLRDLHWDMDSLDLSDAKCDSIRPNALHSRHRLKSVVLTPDVRIIGSQAFFACDGLSELTLPAGVKKIGSRAFGNCTGLHSITVMAQTPPELAEDAFVGTEPGKIKLITPKGTRDAYKNAPGWKKFFEKSSKTVLEPCPEKYAIIPVPTKIEYLDGESLDTKTLGGIVAPASLSNEKSRLAEVLKHRLDKSGKGKSKSLITLEIDAENKTPESYTLEINANGIKIKGADAAGVFYGIMTLDQMLIPQADNGRLEALRAVRVTDAPRTAMRELMVDPCRIFIPFDDLKDFVPEMARYKMNALHLHLTDDQAWRIEIKAFPLLTQKGSMRVGMDDMQMPIEGYYTQEQMKELVAFAKQYHVDIIPEIEMPGHQVAAIHCYPHLTCNAVEIPIRTTCGVSNTLLCPSNPFTYNFLETVFSELSSVFTSKYVHLGGDEAGNPPLECWSGCAGCQNLLKDIMIENGLGEEKLKGNNWRLQKYMFDRVIGFLRKKLDKTPMFWYETDFKEIQPGCVVFAWRHGLTARAIDAAMRCNAKIMLCPGEHCYLDYPADRGDMPEVNWGMPTTTLQQTYKLNPAWGYGADFEKNNLHGVAGTLWSECINSTERIYYMAYPRALALSEAGWSIQSNRSFDDFMLRLKHISRDMHRRGICTATR